MKLQDNMELKGFGPYCSFDFFKIGYQKVQLTTHFVIFYVLFVCSLSSHLGGD